MAAETLKNGEVCAINVVTRHQQEGEISEYHTEKMGQVVSVNGSHYLHFDDTDDDGEKVATTIKLAKDGNVTIIRHTSVSSRMRFFSGKTTSMRYFTPYGSMLIDIVTKKIRITYQNQPFSGKIYIDYELYSGNNKLGEYEIDLNFTV